MFTQTPQKRVLFPCVLTLVMTAVFVVALILTTALYGGFLFGPQKASAATNSTLNFQARLETASGAIVPDGYYNVEFKLYSQSSGGTALWTETYYDANGATAGSDNRVQVRNGYLTANLGSQTAFPGSINWDQDLWVTMNIGGTTQTATPTWDGEMNPRLKLTGVPYAFRAGQLATFNNTTGFTSTLSILQPTGGNQVFQIQDQGAAGTYNLCVQNSTSGCTAAAGSGNYIQNQNSSQQAGSNFWISGTGRADTALQAPSFDTPTAAALSIGTTNATSITVGKVGVNTIIGGNLSVGTAQSFGAITMANGAWFTAVDAAGTGAVNMFQVNANNQIQVGAALNIDGGIILPTNGGQMTLVDLGIDSSASSGAKQSYTLRVGSTNALTVYGEADGTGNAQNVRVAVGSSINPQYTLDVTGDINASGDLRTAGASRITAAGVLQNVTANTSILTAGTLSVARGGTGVSTAPTNGQLLIGNGTGYSLATLGVSGGLTVTNTAGGISLGTDTTICKTSGNCAGAGNGITGTGSINTLAMFTASGTVGNSIISQNGTTIDVSGNIQATVVSINSLQTNGTLRLDATGNLVNINNVSVNGGVNVKGYITTNTSSTFSGQWTKLASCTIVAQYQDCRTQATIVSTSDSGSNDRAIVDIRVKQQNAMAGAPYVSLLLNDTYGIDTSDVSAVVTQNDAATTVVELWGRVNATFRTWNMSPSINTGTVQFSWLSNQPYQAALPAGAAVSATMATLITPTLQNNGTLNVQAIGANQINLNTNGATRWSVLSTGELQGNGASIVRSSTGNITVASNGGNGNVVLTPNGTGNVNVSAGGLQIGGTLVLTAARVLQNVTTDTSILTSGTLGVVRGGTGAASFTANGIIYGNGTGALAVTAAGATGQCLIATTGAAPTWGTCASGGSGVTTVGTIDSQTKSANGAVISGTTIYLQSADATNVGLVSTGVQSFAGNKTFTGSVTVASGQSVTLVGGITSTRPASPTEGMLYFDTTTDQLLTYANGKWKAEGKTTTKIVAASNSTQAAKDSADYVADGTGDQTEINAALTAAAGGKVYLMEGTYVANDTISVPNNTTLMGAGNGTRIELADLDVDKNLITNTDQATGTGVAIQDMYLEGRKDLNTAGVQVGMYLNMMGDDSATTKRSGAKVHNITAANFRTTGVQLDYSSNSEVSKVTAYNNGSTGLSVTSSTRNTLTNNVAQGNGEVGIYLYTSLYNHIDNNSIKENGTVDANAGIFLDGGSAENTVSGNSVTDTTGAGIHVLNSNENQVTGNTIDASTSDGISVIGSDGVTAANNYITGSLDGIFYQSSNYGVVADNAISYTNDNGIDVRGGNNFAITGNVMAGTGDSGIQVRDLAASTISNNNIESSGTSNAAASGIEFVINVDATTVAGNMITDPTGTGYAINIVEATSANNYISDNVYFGTGATTVNDLGTGTIYANQLSPLGQLVNASSNGLVTKLQSGSSADLFQAQNSAGTALAKITSTGIIQSSAFDTMSVTGLSVGTTNASSIAIGNNAANFNITLNSGAGGVTSIASGNFANTITIGTGAGIKGVTIGSTNTTSTLALQGGTGASAITLTAASGGTIGVGSSAVAQVINIGNSTGATAVSISCGTGVCGFGNNAIAHTTTVGSVTGAATTNIQAGTGGLNIGTANVAQTITIGNTTNAVAQTIRIGNNATAGSTSTVNIGSLIGSSATTIQGGTGNINLTTSSAATGVIVKANVDSATAFTVQAGDGVPVFTVDTTDTNLLASLNAGFEVIPLTGWLAKAGGSVARSTAQSYTGNASGAITTPATAGAGFAMPYTFTASTQYTVSLYARLSSGSMSTFAIGRQDVSGTDIDCLTGLTLNNSGWTRFTCTFTTGATITSSNLYVKQTDAVVRSGTIFIDSVQLETGTNATPYGAGHLLLNSTFTTPVSMKNTTNSTTAFMIQNAAGANLLTIDTLNNKIIIGNGADRTEFDAQGRMTRYGAAEEWPSVVLNAEYPNSVLDAMSDSACVSANNGTMTSGYDGVARMNYYNWTSTSATSQCYDIVAQIQIPNSFDRWFIDPLSLQAKTDNTANSSVSVLMTDGYGTVDNNYNYATYTPTTGWTDVIPSGQPAVNATYIPGHTITVKIRMTAKSGANVKIGTFGLIYVAN